MPCWTTCWRETAAVPTPFSILRNQQCLIAIRGTAMVLRVGKKHGYDERKAGANIASQSGVLVAAESFGVSLRTIRRWLTEFDRTAGPEAASFLADARLDSLGERGSAIPGGDLASLEADEAAAARASEDLVRLASACRDAQHGDAPTAALHKVGQALWVSAHDITGMVLDMDPNARIGQPSHQLVRTLLDFADRVAVIENTDPHSGQVATLAEDMERLGNALRDEGYAAIPEATTEPAASR